MENRKKLLLCVALESLNEIELLEKQKRKKRKMWVRTYYKRDRAKINYIEMISTMNIEGNRG